MVRLNKVLGISGTVEIVVLAVEPVLVAKVVELLRVVFMLVVLVLLIPVLVTLVYAVLVTGVVNTISVEVDVVDSRFSPCFICKVEFIGTVFVLK